jgi:hypothetical protein
MLGSDRKFHFARKTEKDFVWCQWKMLGFSLFGVIEGL